MHLTTFSCFIDVCIDQLQAMFPCVPKNEIIKEYRGSGCDINRTISILLGDNDNSGKIYYLYYCLELMLFFITDHGKFPRNRQNW